MSERAFQVLINRTFAVLLLMMQISHLLVVAVTSSSLHIHMLMDIGTGALLTGRKQNLVAAGKKLAGIFPTKSPQESVSCFIRASEQTLC